MRARSRVASVGSIAFAIACGGTQRGDEGLFGDGSQSGIDSSGAPSEESEGGGASSNAPGDSDGDGETTPADDTLDPIFDVGMGDSGGADDGGTMGAGCSYIDVLFVVDISASMHEEQANLAANFPAFVQVLDDYVGNDGNALGYRIGVTNSSVNFDYDGCATTMGLDGALFGGSAFSGDCGTAGSPWLDGPSAGISDGFSCLAEHPIPGNGGSDCGHERPLDTLEMFVEKSATGDVNDGFYRGDDSLLVLVLLTDEDDDADWTTTNPAQTKSVLDTFAAGEDRYVVVTVAGPGPGQCESAFGEAIEAATLRDFTEMVPNGLFGDICQGDLTTALSDALELIQLSCDVLPPPEG